MVDFVMVDFVMVDFVMVDFVREGWRRQVGGQDLDSWQPGPGHAISALRTYYQHYMTTQEENKELEVTWHDSPPLFLAHD